MILHNCCSRCLSGHVFTHSSISTSLFPCFSRYPSLTSTLSPVNSLFLSDGPGYMLLAGRVRKPEECHVICEVIEKHLKRRVDPNLLFTLSEATSPTTKPILTDITTTPPAGFDHVVWTYSLRRMAVLVGQALKFGEPVLLVGDTGYV